MAIVASQEPSYLVFFARDPVDDELADAILERVRGCAEAGWFDDPGADSPAERTTGGYVRGDDVEAAVCKELLDVARAVSADHDVLVEVQWREEPLGVLERGDWRAAPPTER